MIKRLSLVTIQCIVLGELLRRDCVCDIVIQGDAPPYPLSLVSPKVGLGGVATFRPWNLTKTLFGWVPLTPSSPKYGRF